MCTGQVVVGEASVRKGVIGGQRPAGQVVAGEEPSVGQGVVVGKHPAGQVVAEEEPGQCIVSQLAKSLKKRNQAAATSGVAVRF